MNPERKTRVPPKMRVAVARAGALFAGASLWSCLVLIFLEEMSASRDKGRWQLAAFATFAILWQLSTRVGFSSSERSELGLAIRAIGTLVIGVSLLVLCALLLMTLALLDVSDVRVSAVCAALGACLVFVARRPPTDKRGRMATAVTVAWTTGAAVALVGASALVSGTPRTPPGDDNPPVNHTKHILGHLADARPPKTISIGEVFELRAGESAALRSGTFTLTVESVDYSPMEWAHGAEMWPYSVFHVSIQCDSATQRRDFSGTAVTRVGRYFELKIDHAQGEDEGFFVVTRTLPSPNLQIVLGVESPELAQLRSVNDLHVAAPARASWTLFPNQAVPSVASRLTGLRLTALMERDDPSVDDAIVWLTQDASARALISALLARAGRYRPAIEDALEAQHVPVEAVAAIFVRNGFFPVATEPDEAAGLWSLRADVAKAYDLTIDAMQDERRGVETASLAAARYLSSLHERFGSWELALYASSRGYRETLIELDNPQSVNLEDLVHRLDPASLKFVSETLAVATLLLNPERFGLEALHAEAPIASDNLAVPALTSFGDIAQAAGISTCQVAELNPQYLSATVPRNRTTARVPRESLALAQRTLVPILMGHIPRVRPALCQPADLAPPETCILPASKDTGDAKPPTNGPHYYRVRDGDTLDSLARRFGVAPENIARDNRLDPLAHLVSSQLLVLRLEDASRTQ